MDDEKKDNALDVGRPEIVFNKEVIQIIDGDKIPYGVYNIRNTNSGKYLHRKADKKGVNIHLWDHPQTTNAQWVVDTVNGTDYIIRSTEYSGYLNVAGGSSKSGTNIELGYNPESKRSQWKIKNINLNKGIFTIKNIDTSKFINVSGGGTKNGTNIQISDDPESSHTQWKFYCVLSLIKDFSVYEGMYNIQNVKATKKYLNVSTGKDVKGKNIQLWDNPESEDSQFVIKRVDEKKNLYTLRYSKSQYNYLNIGGGSKNNGGNVKLWNNPESNHSRFYFDLIDEPSMRVAIRNANSNLFVTCSGSGGGTKKGTNIQQWANIQSSASQWYLTPLDMKLVRVEFDLDKAMKGDAKPDVLASITVSGNESSDQSVTFKNSETVTTESSFEHSHGFKITVGVETEIKCGTPLIGSEQKVKMSTSFETSHNWKNGNKSSISKTFEWDVQVKAEKGKTVKCNAIIIKRKLDVPYTAICKSKSVGTTIESHGVWHGVSCYDLKFDYQDL